jgi:hypothetical protein
LPALTMLAGLAVGTALHTGAKATYVAQPQTVQAAAYIPLSLPENTGNARLIPIDISRTAAPAPAGSSASAPAAPGATALLADKFGPIQTTPQIYVVFVGSQWQNSPSPSVTAAMTQTLAFYRGIAGSRYNQALSQYRGAGQTPQLVAAWIDLQTITTTVNPFTDVQRIVKTAGIPSGTNTQIDLIYPPNFTFTTSSESNAIGFHSSGDGVAYAAISYLSGDANSLTVTASHEYDETVTDPLGDVAPNSGVADPAFLFRTAESGQVWSEVADVCASSNPVLWNGIALARMYDAQTQTCVAPPLDG